MASDTLKLTGSTTFSILNGFSSLSPTSTIASEIKFIHKSERLFNVNKGPKSLKGLHAKCIHKLPQKKILNVTRH